MPAEFSHCAGRRVSVAGGGGSVTVIPLIHLRSKTEGRQCRAEVRGTVQLRHPAGRRCSALLDPVLLLASCPPVRGNRVEASAVQPRRRPTRLSVHRHHQARGIDCHHLPDVDRMRPFGPLLIQSRKYTDGERANWLDPRQASWFAPGRTVSAEGVRPSRKQSTDEAANRRARKLPGGPLTTGTHAGSGRRTG
jgi:hypothetical protein